MVERKITYRTATPEDIQEKKIIEFAYNAMSDSEMLPNFAKDGGENLLERIYSADPRNFILAEDKEQDFRMVGYIEIDPERKSSKTRLTTEGKILSKAYYIRGIYVLPEYRRQGIGQELLKRIAKERLSEGEELRVEAFSEIELKFWQNSLGFKIHHYSLAYDSKNALK